MATAAKKKPKTKQKPKPLTPRERRLLAILPEAKTYQEALMGAGYSESTATKYAKQTINNILGKTSNINTLQEAFKKHGIDDNKIAEKHAEGLEAYKVISATVVHGKGKDAGSQTNDFIEVPDFPARHKHLETIHKIRGDHAKDQLEITGDVTVEIMDYAGEKRDK